MRSCLHACASAQAVPLLPVSDMFSGHHAVGLHSVHPDREGQQLVQLTEPIYWASVLQAASSGLAGGASASADDDEDLDGGGGSSMSSAPGLPPPVLARAEQLAEAGWQPVAASGGGDAAEQLARANGAGRTQALGDARRGGGRGAVSDPTLCQWCQDLCLLLPGIEC
jgi:hypothetical protein